MLTIENIMEASQKYPLEYPCEGFLKDCKDILQSMPADEQCFSETLMDILSDLHKKTQDKDNFNIWAIHTIDLFLQERKLTATISQDPEDYDDYLIECRALVSLAITSKWYVVLDFLAKNNLGINVEGGGFTPLMEAIYYNDQRAFHSLVPYCDINEMTRQGHTALLYASSQKKFWAIEKLLTYSNLEFKMPEGDITVLAHLRHTPYFDKVISYFKHKIEVDNFNFKQMVHFPIAFLPKEKQDILKNNIINKMNKMEVFKAHPQLQDYFLNFLTSEKPLAFDRLNRVAIAYEILLYLLNPHLIGQRNKGLCGPATAMQLLCIKDPVGFISSIIAIAELPNKITQEIELPKKIKNVTSDCLKTCYDVIGLWQETIKHNYNVVTGYNTKILESQFAPTTPYQLERILNDFGLEVFKESMQVRLHKSSKMFPILDKPVRLLSTYVSMFEPFKIYSNKHTLPTDIKDDLEQLELYLIDTSDIATIQISSDLLAQLMGDNLVNSDFLIESSHYLNVTKFKIKEDNNSINMSYMTHGKKISSQSKHGEIFARIYGCYFDQIVFSSVRFC